MAELLPQEVEDGPIHKVKGDEPKAKAKGKAKAKAKAKAKGKKKGKAGAVSSGVDSEDFQVIEYEDDWKVYLHDVASK